MSNKLLFKEWVKQKAKITEKELKIKNFQVMQAWEEPYMEMLAEIVSQNGGTVLEIGFGMGISSYYIQKINKIDLHIIIEAHPDIAKYAMKMFRKEIGNERIIIINSFWENIVSYLKHEGFDGILFDTSPLDQEVKFYHFFPFFKEAYKLLKKGGIFTYFSDEAKKFSSKHLKELHKAGFRNISFKICKVNPPKSCRYWKHNTIIAPIVIK